MSAEMIAAWFFTKGAEFDVPAAKEALVAMDDEALLTATGDSLPYLDDPAEVRETLEARLDLLTEFEHNGGMIVPVPGGLRMWLAGGESYGDDPNEAFTAISDLLSVPEVMRAGGMTDTADDVLARTAVELWNEYGDPNDVLSERQVQALTAAADD